MLLTLPDKGVGELFIGAIEVELEACLSLPVNIDNGFRSSCWVVVNQEEVKLRW